MATLINTSTGPVKVTMFMSQGRYTWSEAHYLLNFFDLVSAQAMAYQMANLRALCLGNNAAMVGVRLGLTPSNRQVVDLNPAIFTTSGIWPADPSGGNYSSDQPYSALLIKVPGTISSKNLYFAGIPDNVVLTSPGFPSGVDMTPAFSTAFNNYMSFIASNPGNSGVGFRSRNKSGDVFAGGLVTNALYPNAIGVQSLIPIPGLGVGSEAYLSGWRRINTRSPGLAGVFQVVGFIPAGISGGLATYFLGETGNISPTNFIGLGSIGPLAFNFINYQGWVTRRAVSRKRGGSYDRPRGKSSVRR